MNDVNMGDVDNLDVYDYDLNHKKDSSALNTKVDSFRSEDKEIKNNVYKISFGEMPLVAEDLNRVAIGYTVIHKTFGEGTVTDLSDKYIIVSFGKAEKRFEFLDSFNKGFLKLK